MSWWHTWIGSHESRSSEPIAGKGPASVCVAIFSNQITKEKICHVQV